jgi:hypothetical protein
MSKDEYKAVQKLWFAALELIIHGRPKDTDESRHWWHEGAVETHTNFSKFLRENQPDECN